MLTKRWSRAAVCLAVCLALSLALSFFTAYAAQAFSVQCPAEGLFTGPLEVGDLPNPSAGWDVFLEGKPLKIELLPPLGAKGFWLITCQIDIGGGTVEISAHVDRKRACQLSTKKGVITSLQNGGQSCSIAPGSTGDASDDRCAVICD
jgi:hypothetical protein